MCVAALRESLAPSARRPTQPPARSLSYSPPRSNISAVPSYCIDLPKCMGRVVGGRYGSNCEMLRAVGVSLHDPEQASRGGVLVYDWPR